MNKKRIILIAAVLMLFGGNSILAQDCRTIVLPMCNYNEDEYEMIPEDKLEIHCAYSRNMFYFADEWKEGNPIYNIWDVRENRSGNMLDKNVKINLDSLSYYAYNFIEFHARHNGKEIYFYTPQSEHKYLVMRTTNDALNRTKFPENYED